jgi:sorting nexin-9/18/33
MEQNENDATTNLTKAITFTGESYEEISKLVDDQPKNDWMPLADMMYQYSGMLDVWTNILKVHSGALGKIKEADDVVREGKLTQTEAKEIKDRTDVISYALLAEINTFDNVLCKEIRDAHKDFLKAQITHHQKITEKLQSALSMYDNC